MQRPLRLLLLPFPALLLASALAPASAQIASTVQSTFESDLDGWTAINFVEFKQEAAGGNPGGRLFIDPNESQVCYVFAPSKFLGDKSLFVGGTLSFEGLMVGTGGSPWFNPLDYGHVRLTGGGFSAEVDLSPGLPSDMAWEYHYADLTPAVWGMTLPNFTAMMSSLTEIRISVEALFGPEKHVLDNVRLHAQLPDATCTPRNGSGVNPADFACLTQPVVGGAWASTIAMTPATQLSIVAIGAGGPDPGSPNPFGTGELLIKFSPQPLWSFAVGLHTVPIPPQPQLVGAAVSTQGARLLTAGGVEALNAIDLVLGV